MADRRPHRLTLAFGPEQAPRHVIDVIDIVYAEPAQGGLLRLGRLVFGYRETPALSGASAKVLEREARFCKALAATLVRAHLLVGWTRGHEGLEAFALERRCASEAEGAKLMLVEADVVIMGIERSLAKLRYSPGAVSQLELFLSAPCDQACRFCVYPYLDPGHPALGRSPGLLEWAAQVFAELDARPGPSAVQLSGPDVLRDPRLGALLDLLARYSSLEVELLGPMTGLADPQLAEAVLGREQVVAMRTTLLSHRPEVHDALVGRAGAHADVLAAIDAALARGLCVGVNSVLTPDNAGDLTELLRLLEPWSGAGVDLQVQLYHPEALGMEPEGWRALALERLVCGPAQIRAAFAELARAPDADALLSLVSARHIAHCWLPASIRERVVEPVAEPQDNFTTPPACADCPGREGCPGLTMPAFERWGPEAASPLKSPSGAGDAALSGER
ncbi:radical SAM protein [Pseudenhygromyxa sp. WMMC2535]|uniref:radical SAM protein n=1 Tax=Pseudenhygromyxa sp. WMMC2535 TaxID=2712867 RepID=UPI001553BBD6|nr:radical SAM protein [Pseudenhygromyxa sp. WMMC2535]NVB40306.1 radical SAM protein [Pseudenhygromyxa sp. WMMC2535]NVB43511.1 radical SAM protein [Pseudenhygromyxa sp. WMMC2535]